MIHALLNRVITCGRRFRALRRWVAITVAAAISVNTPNLSVDTAGGEGLRAEVLEIQGLVDQMLPESPVATPGKVLPEALADVLALQRVLGGAETPADPERAEGTSPDRWATVPPLTRTDVVRALEPARIRFLHRVEGNAIRCRPPLGPPPHYAAARARYLYQLTPNAPPGSGPRTISFSM